MLEGVGVTVGDVNVDTSLGQMLDGVGDVKADTSLGKMLEGVGEAIVDTSVGYTFEGVGERTFFTGSIKNGRLSSTPASALNEDLLLHTGECVRTPRKSEDSKKSDIAAVGSKDPRECTISQES